jgi:AcrR family transcriptional regulator
MGNREAASADSGTAQRIIAVASEEFARHGYASARVRQIVDAAGVNLASINYYFGGKEGLYSATLHHLASRERVEGPARNRRGQSTQERLHRQVYAILARYLGAKRPSALRRILAHEAMNPTVHLERLIEEMMRPELETVRAIVRSLAGAEADDCEVAHAAVSVMGQCLFYLFSRGPIDRLHPELTRGPDACKRLAQQIAEFSLAGIARLRTPRGER